MAIARRTRFAWTASTLIAATIGSSPAIHAFAQPAPATPPRPPGVANDLRPATGEATLILDPRRPVQLVAFHMAGAAEADRTVDVVSDDPAVCRPSGPATVLSGRTLAFAMLEPAAPGTTTVRIGGVPVAIRVLDAGPLPAGTPLGAAPELLTPRPGAAVWGKVMVGAGAWALAADAADGPSSALVPPIRLRIGDGPDARTLAPVWSSSPDAGPYRLVAFEVDFDAEPTGPCQLTPVRAGTGTEIGGAGLVVQVVRPAPGLIASGECEADYGLADPRFVGPPSPPRSSPDKTASGGRYFSNVARDPRCRFPLNVGEDEGPGWYQVMLTAGGDAAVGALPSVGVAVDEQERPVTTATIAAPAWHRVPVGRPVRLEPGFHTLRLDFMNDFAAKGTDRNLRLDRVEVARVADARAGGAGDAALAMQDMPTESAMQPAAASPGPGGAGAADAMGAMMNAGDGGPGVGWPASAAAAPARIALAGPLDGLTACGVFEVAGRTWLPEHSGTPLVALAIDGRIVQRQRSDSPRFVLTPDAVRVDGSTVELVGLTDAGAAFRTTPARVARAAALAAEWPRQSRRLTVHDRAWISADGAGLKPDKGGEQRLSLALAQGATARVRLPEELEGEFDVWLEARSGGGPQAVEIALAGDEGTKLSRTIPGSFDAHEFTRPTQPGLRLAKGPKELAITLPAPAGKGKPNAQAAWAQAVRLVERPASTREPAVSLDYPADGQPVLGADALVASLASPERLESAEVVIDGRPTGLRHDLRRSMNGLGRACVPVLLSGLAPGEHAVALRVTDARGRSATSAPRRVTVLAQPSGEPTPYERAVRVLDRLAFGPEPRELGDCLRLGPEAYLADRLARAAGDDSGEADAAELGAVRFPNARSGGDVPRRAIARTLASANPVRARLVLWAQNHFSTWVRKDEASRKTDEDAAFAALGAARFADLLYTSATGPAMLRYLDQERSYGSRLNENYAREIMELHTLGVRGGYSQRDVTELARVLTGWTTTRLAPGAAPRTPDDDGQIDAFRYDPVLADPLKTPAEVVGLRFGERPAPERAGRVGLAVEMLAAHPSTARFVSAKLAAHFAADPAPEALVDAMAAAFLRSGGDLREAVLAMVREPAFWSAAAEPRLAHPNDFALRLCRAARHDNAGDVAEFLASSGRGLFDRPTPDGYPEADGESMDSNALLQRWKLATRAAGAMASAIPSDLRYSEAPITPELAGTIVDLLSVRLTGRPLGPAARAAALGVLRDAGPPPREAALRVLRDAAPALPARPQDLQRDGQIQTVAAFIAQLPEANVK